MTPINREERLAYLDLFHKVRDDAIDSPFHFLVFDGEQSPILQSLTLDEILCLHPTDAPIHNRVCCCKDVVEILRVKRELWLSNKSVPQRRRRNGTVMLVIPTLDGQGRRGPGSWETVFRR